MTNLAGDGSPGFRDGPQPTQSSFSDPFGLAVSADGSVYVADAGDNNRIRKLSREGPVTTVAGSVEGFADGVGANAKFNTPSGLAIDSSGSLYVADTGNNRIRKVTPEGSVSTVAGDGTSGYQDGPAASARFAGPLGVTVNARGEIYVADTYNDRIRKISPDGQVSTIAGAGRTGFLDGASGSAQFDTPSSIATLPDQSLLVADTGNNCIRKISPDGQVTTLSLTFAAQGGGAELHKPVGLVATHDSYLYVTEFERSRVIQVSPDNVARVITLSDGQNDRFNQLTGVAVNKQGDLFVSDSGNYLVRKLAQTPTSPQTASASTSVATESLPRLTKETLGLQSLAWPLDPQGSPHEVAATMGEVRGSFDTTDSRHHLHSGLDVFGGYGETVRVVRGEKVSSPIANWGFGDINEGIRLGIISYIHIHVGRDKDSNAFDDSRFVLLSGVDGKPMRVRVRRGARFNSGEALGTINRMYHVHMNVGPPGGEINPLSLSPIGFSDRVPPTIEKDGVQLFDETGNRLSEKKEGRLLVNGKIRIVVDAFDRADLNAERRRLGLYKLGYQVLNQDQSPVAGFEQPRITIVFDRLPPDREATKIAYAAESGITVYGSSSTRFLYEVTNTVRDGHASNGTWDTTSLGAGSYILRITAADFSGNEAQEGRDVLVTVK